MSRELQSTTIDGDLYEMTLFGATQGYRMFHRLFSMLGPTFGKVMDAMTDASIQDVDFSSDAAILAIRALSDHVTERDMDYVIAALREQTSVGVGGHAKTVPLKGVFELHFSGRIDAMFKWVAWGLKVQYQSFFDAFNTMKPPGRGDALSAAGSANR